MAPRAHAAASLALLMWEAKVDSQKSLPQPFSAGPKACHLGSSRTSREPTGLYFSNMHDFYGGTVRQTWVAAVAHPTNCRGSLSRRDIMDALSAGFVEQLGCSSPPVHPTSERDVSDNQDSSLYNNIYIYIYISMTRRAKPRETGGGERRAATAKRSESTRRHVARREAHEDLLRCRFAATPPDRDVHDRRSV